MGATVPPLRNCAPGLTIPQVESRAGDAVHESDASSVSLSWRLSAPRRRGEVVNRDSKGFLARRANEEAEQLERARLAADAIRPPRASAADCGSYLADPAGQWSCADRGLPGGLRRQAGRGRRLLASGSAG